MVSLRGLPDAVAACFFGLGLFYDWPCFLSHVKCMVCVWIFFLLRVVWEEEDGDGLKWWL